jgi:hypothetical protein
MKLYLYEGLNTQDRASVLLWESAGRKLVEAQLTADQITQLFQQIQTAKGNRTLVGKGVDAGGAAAKAWNDLKSKLYNSGPMEGFAAAYDQAAEKLKQATGGDQGAMQYVQKYRDFAKKHPILQGFLYSALIAAAGISSAGLGGAAALALLKTTDKALQGEDIRSALYSGAKTGALAYGASKLGDLIRGGDQAQQVTSKLPANANWMDYEAALEQANPALLDRVKDIINDPGVTDEFKTQYLKNLYTFGKDITDPARITNLVQAQYKLADAALQAADQATLAAAGNPNFESRDLSRKQVLALFERVAHLNSRMLNEGRLEEGIWDDIKSGAGKGLQGIKSLAGKTAGAVAQGAAKVGRSMTAKVSSDALTKAWEKAGKPTDSVEIEKLLQAQGVNPEVVKTVFQANSIPLSVAAGASTGSAGVDANEPMPDVMSTNRAETPAPIEPATASAGPGAQVAQQQAQQAPQQTTQQPASAEPATSPADQGAVAQGVQQAQSQQQQPSATASKLPDVTRLTPEQKKQLLAQIDKQLASMPAATAQQPTPPAPQPSAAPAPTAPTQSATANKMPASITPVATTQQAIAAKMPVATKTAKPKVPYSAVAQKATPAKVSAPRNPGAPTDTEYNKFQDLLKQALDKQGA